MPSSLTTPIFTDVRKYTGDPVVPWDIRNQRIYSLEVFRRMGTPCLVKHRYNIEDVENGVAVESPTMDDIYEQATYAEDQISYGVGFVSTQTQDGEWYDPATGNLYITPLAPQSSYLPAPTYRGFGPGYLIYAILPDRPEDTWKLTPQGAMIRQQTAMAQFPWYPKLGDNDLLITCQINADGTIAKTEDRYLLKMVTPITMRGADRLGNIETQLADAAGNRFWVGQQSELTKVPSNDPIYNVEADR